MSLEIPSKDRSYGWMLQWLSERGLHESHHLSVETTVQQHERCVAAVAQCPRRRR